MQRVNEYRFYALGQKLEQIKTVEPGTFFKDCFVSLWEARDAIEELLNDPLQLRVCGPVARRLRDAISAIVPTDFQHAITKAEVIRSPGQDDRYAQVGYAAFEVERALKEFEPVLAAECGAMATYVVSQKRGYATANLVEGAEVMLSAEAVAVLPARDGIVNDIRSAGRCLAFDTPTAAGFHILRAVEAVMALYYTHLTGQRLKKQNRNWGLYLQKLAKVSKADPKIQGALTHIKDHYRNPILHPEVTLTEGQAIMLFGLCLSAIELMVEVLRTTPPALSPEEEAKALAALAGHEPAEEDF